MPNLIPSNSSVLGFIKPSTLDFEEIIFIAVLERPQKKFQDTDFVINIFIKASSRQNGMKDSRVKISSWQSDRDDGVGAETKILKNSHSRTNVK